MALILHFSVLHQPSVLWLQDTSAAEANDPEVDQTPDHVALDNGCPPQLKQKQLKEQKNMSRTHGKNKEQELKHGPGGSRESVTAAHVVEVDVEINTVNDDGASRPVRPCSKRKSNTPQKARRNPCTNVALVDARRGAGSPSRASLISDTAAEELCELRSYYSKQLRRINYISHECLAQPAASGVLACIREPLRSLRLPRRVTIAQTARSLWTRVSGRRKLLHR